MMSALDLLLLAAAGTAASDSTARPVSLAEAVTLAQRNAPVVIQALGQQRVGAAGVRSAYGAFLPSLSLTAGASRQVPVQAGQTRVENGQVVTLAPEPWSFNAGLGASVALFSGGRRLSDLRQARAQSVVADLNVGVQSYAAALAAKQQFFNVLAARESEAAARAQLEQAAKQLQYSVVRLRARTVTRSDSLRSEIQVHNARLALVQARTALDLANASLTRALGVSSPVTAAADDSLDRPGLTLDDAALRRLALEGPAVQQAQASLDASRAALQGAWAGYLPSVTASYSRSGNGTGSEFTLGTEDYSYSGALRLSLSFPLFDQFQREQQMTQSRAARDYAEAALRDARLGALESLTQSLGSFHSAEARIATQVATVEAAEEDLREEQDKYTIGAATQVDVLTSQATLDQARHDLIQARYDQRVAKAQLEALVGRSL